MLILKLRKHSEMNSIKQKSRKTAADILVYRNVHKMADMLLQMVLEVMTSASGFGGLEVAKYAGSNPAEVVGFFSGRKKSSARLPSEGK